MLVLRTSLLRALVLIAAIVALSCSAPQPPPGHGSASSGRDSDLFIDVAASVGLDFVHDAHASAELYMAEIISGGVALLDLEGDGDLDVFLVEASALADPTPRVPGRLYRNELAEIGRLRFSDVSGSSGIGAPSWPGSAMGAAVGDVDGDGLPDLYITRFGPDLLYRNLGGGRFEDVTQESGLGDTRWTVSASFLDYDGDRVLDLFAVSYVDFTLANHRDCRTAGGHLEYCGPLTYDPLPDRLSRGLGDGRFEDVTAAAGLGGHAGRGLGALAIDLDDDGMMDIYVANDAMENRHWRNNGDGTFSESALLAGTAFSADGMPEASMGVTAGDVDGDGDEDLALTHLAGETHTIYLAQGQGWFDEATALVNFGSPSLPYTGFGTGFLDYDNDGRLDFMSFHGRVVAIEELRRRGDPHPYHQPDQLLRNITPVDGGDPRFKDMSQRAGAALSVSTVSRGAAFGDIDNDGDMDVVTTANGGPARLLLNQVGNRAHWLGVQLVDSAGHPDPAGARAWVELGGRTLLRTSRRDGSFASSSDPRLLFGLGEHAGHVAVRVCWPGGKLERFEGLEVDEWTRLHEGKGVSD